MKTTINIYSFRDMFRAVRPDNFSYEGLGLLFEYLEQYEQDCDTELELDVIALCCDYSEAPPIEIAEAYNVEVDDVVELLESAGVYVGTTDEGMIIYNVNC